jgi:hypothetical protein
MAGLDPAIQIFLTPLSLFVDGRINCGHDKCTGISAKADPALISRPGTIAHSFRPKARSSQSLNKVFLGFGFAFSCIPASGAATGAGASCAGAGAASGSTARG